MRQLFHGGDCWLWLNAGSYMTRVVEIVLMWCTKDGGVVPVASPRYEVEQTPLAPVTELIENTKCCGTVLV